MNKKGFVDEVMKGKGDTLSGRTEMAGVAQNVVSVVSSESGGVVFEPDVSSSDSLSFTINSADGDGTSLQDLIDSELAIRISSAKQISTDTNVNLLDPDIDKDTNRQFIMIESQHTSLNFVNNNDIVNTNTDNKISNGSLTTENNESDLKCSIVDIARKQATENGEDVQESCENEKNNTVDMNKPQENNENNLLIDISSTDTTTPTPLTNGEAKIDSPVLIDIKISAPDETIDNPDNLKIDTPSVDITELSECMTNNSPQLTEEDKGDSNVSKSSSSFSLIDPILPVFKDPLPPTGDDFDTWTTVAEATTDDVEPEPEVNATPKQEQSLIDTPPVIVEISEIKKEQDKAEEELVRIESVSSTKTETKSSIIEAVSCTREIVIIEQTATTNGPKSPEAVDQTDASPVSVQHALCHPVVGSNKPKDNTESSESVITEKKTVKKKKSSEGGETTATKTKKTKKTKKSEEKENHISVKSSFSKFDQLQKKTLLHVRSSDSSRAQKTFGGASEPAAAPVVNPSCKSCGKTVFAMEQVKAERSVWHKNCFRCNECNKQLTLDIYSSHEGVLYCKPHFRELFKPKAVVENDDEPVVRRRPEMIIRENQPLELPPDVVRASDKPDLGLEELNSLNVKSRFQAFEKPVVENGHDSQPSNVNVKRSPSILSKLAKFQKKGMDIGVTDESLNGIDYEESSSSGEEEDEDGVVRGTKAVERPTAFGKMEDVKRTWESGQTQRKEEWLEERKLEKHSIRSRLFMGKQGKMKEMYEQAVADSEGRGGNVMTRKEVEALRSDKARVVREKFERGEVLPSDSDEETDKNKANAEDMSVFEEGISKKSRSLFLEMDANVAKTKQSTPAPQPVQHQNSLDATRRARDTESPEREIYRDPNVVRSDDANEEDEAVVKRSMTTSKMLSIFRQMEDAKETVPDGPKPLKRFTPPPDYKEEEEEESEEEEEESEEESEEEESEEETNGIVRASDKIEDEFLKQAQNAARAKSLKEKFEHWEPERQSKNNAINMLDSDQASLDSTKSLRAHFESLKSEQPKEKSRPKVNRFV